MRTKLTYLLSLSSLLVMVSCATSNQTAQQVDQNDDVYYSEARAKEKAEVIAKVPTENSRKSDYVTEEELYGDAYSGDYAVRINRFRNYAPWRGYYNNMYGNPYGNMYGYGNVYNNYYDSYYSSNNYYGGPMLNLSLGFNNGFYRYNPWRYYGYNYGSNFMGPYTYYNPYGMGFGGGYYGNNGFYGNGSGVGRPVYTSPNNRPRPVRGSDGLPSDPATVNGGNVRGVSGNGTGGNVIQDRTRAGRYNGGTSTTPSSDNTRPATAAPRPERVSQQPQRTSQPERVNSSPPPSNNDGGGGRSNDSGGSSNGGRPLRGN
ncbi:hypothetical protein [Daejeonella sp.]|uniref:hypothetical protein n=1 Tax=Daejeonella sp. TaxID=2805397 RepID=UPI0039830C31